VRAPHAIRSDEPRPEAMPRSLRARRLSTYACLQDRIGVKVSESSNHGVEDRSAQDLMESAWAARRASFDLPAGQRRAVMESARSDLELAAALLRDTDEALTLAHALHLLAHVELGLGEEERAEELWREAVAMLRGCDDPLQLAHKLRHLGDLEMGRARMRQAAAHYAEALQLYRTHGGADEPGLANAVRRSALIKTELGETAEARELWLEARDRYGRLGIGEGVVEADEHLR